ncbi:MAG: TIGR03790 family protein [Bryobacteraceae bacterium]|nr:TIGR03790 family protein [Bryobacteraceae bacterium]
MQLQGQTAANVLLVANDASPLSGEIAQYYQKARSIPAANFCRVKTEPLETVERGVYVKLEQAITKCLAKLGTAEIRYIVLTQGVPLQIASTVNSGKINADGASVDSELAFLYARRQGMKTPLEGPLPNPLYRQRDTPFTQRAFPIYLVTRLAGYSLADVRAMIDRGLAARNRGRAVVDLRDESDVDGNNWLRTAALLLPADRVLLDESTRVLEGVSDVIAYASWGSNDKARKQRFLKMKWLPGAIATEYVSSNGRTFERPPAAWTLGTWTNPSGWWKGSPQSLTADYLWEGASGATGHVNEPFLSQTPRPEFMLPAYLGGRNWAESAYLSIPSLSWMNIVVGDPLMRLAAK